MSTLQELLDSGYQIYEGFSLNDFSYKVNYSAEMQEDMYDANKKVITYVPLILDIIPVSIEIQYIFEEAVVIGTMLYNDDCFKFTHNGLELDDVLQELVFQYSDFAYDLRKNNPSWGTFSEAVLILSCKNSEDESIVFKSHYYHCSFERNQPEMYTGAEKYWCGNLIHFSNVLLMYQIYDINDLKRKIEDLIK